MAVKNESGMVTVKLPRPASPTDANFVTVSVNYKVYKIQKGVSVEVPKEVAEVLEAAEKAENEAYNIKMAMANEYQEKAEKVQ